MNSKMTTKSPLLTTESKKQEQTQTKQTTRTRIESQNGDRMKGYQWGKGRERMEER